MAKEEETKLTKLTEAAKARAAGKSGKELITAGAETKEGRRALLEEGVLEGVAVGESAPEEIMKASERGIAKTLEVAGPNADLRTLAATSEEARRSAATDVLAAKEAAAAGKVEGAIALEEAGDISADIETKSTELANAVTAAINAHKGFFDDDEEGMYRDIMTVVNNLPDTPEYDELRAEYTQKAEDIKSKKWDV